MTPGDIISREELRSCFGGNTSHRVKFLAVSRLAEKLMAGREKSVEGGRKYEMISVCLCVCNVVPHHQAFCPLAKNLS